jgi:CheY-like chemotaxis protein
MKAIYYLMVKGTILLVDDDEMSSQILSFILVDEGYNVDLAATGEAGVTNVSNKKYDLVLLDFLLPDMKGHEAASKMRRVSPTLRIVLLTGFSMNGDEIPIEVSYERVLQKPVPPELIIKIIAECLG